MTIEDRFRFFVDVDCRGTSELYAALGARMLDDPALLALLPSGTNPVLLFAVINHLGGMSDDYGTFRAFIADHREVIADQLTTRFVQTNEVGRAAAFLPALATIEGPIALVEVGASAGLNLLLDRFAYDYGGTRIGDSPVVVSCEPRGAVPVPDRMPVIVWRAGLDRNPINIHDDADVSWLRACVFADNTDRLERLGAAMTLARSDPPVVRPGDVVDDLERLVSDAPSDATVVVMSSAVLPYLAAERVDRFQELVADLGVRWLSLEAWFFLDRLRRALPRRAEGVTLLLGWDGSDPLAFVHPHGRWIEWL